MHMEQDPHLSSEELLRAAAGGYRSLIEELPAVPRLLSLDPLSTLYVSPQIESLTGFPPERLIDDPDLWLQVIHDEDRERIRAVLADHAVAGTPISEEYRMSAEGGRIVWVREESRAIADDTGRPVASQGILLDITDRKLLEEELESNVELRRALASRLVRTEEDERARIATEIFGGPIQVLSQLKIRVDELIPDLSDERQAAELTDVADTMERAIDRLGLIVSELRPPLRDASGLISVIRFLLRELAESGDVTPHLDDRVREEVSPETGAVVYRLINESLANVRKHALARNVVVAMESSEGGILVTVEDNGKGFDVARIEQDPAHHIGLQLMRERAEGAGGRYSVESAFGDGTTVEFWIPSPLGPR